VIVDGERSLRACLVALIRLGGDGRAHSLDDNLPFARAGGIDSGLVVVVPRRHRGGRDEERYDGNRSLHGFDTSFSSSSKFTPPKSTVFGRVMWPASTTTSNVVVFPAGPLIVTRYLPGARSSRVGVERLSSFSVICCLLRSSTIL